MKHVFLVTACAFFFLFPSSCRKGNDPIPGNSNPLTDDDQVMEYHKPDYDNRIQAPFAAHVPYLFKKTYSGKTVTEIDCSFNDDGSPIYFLTQYYHELKVTQHGRMVYLVNKQLGEGGIPDTVATVTLNAAGRPESCATNPEIAQDFVSPTWIVQHYYYQNDKIIAVKAEFTSPNSEFPHNPTLDSLHYDSYGNLVSFFGNSYTYDYSKKPKKQFYCEAFMSNQEPFYLLQYLGYFPEVNCPTNLMTGINNIYDDWAGPLTSHQFDAKGRLTSYVYPGGPVTITWK